AIAAAAGARVTTTTTAAVAAVATAAGSATRAATPRRPGAARRTADPTTDSPRRYAGDCSAGLGIAGDPDEFLRRGPSLWTWRDDRRECGDTRRDHAKTKSWRARRDSNPRPPGSKP